MLFFCCQLRWTQCVLMFSIFPWVFYKFIFSIILRDKFLYFCSWDISSLSLFCMYVCIRRSWIGSRRRFFYIYMTSWDKMVPKRLLNLLRENYLSILVQIQFVLCLQLYLEYDLLFHWTHCSWFGDSLSALSFVIPDPVRTTESSIIVRLGRCPFLIYTGHNQ